MLKTYQFKRAICPKLMDELALAGVPSTLPDLTSAVTYLDADQTEDGVPLVWVRCEESQFDTVASVLAVHDELAMVKEQTATSAEDSQQQKTVREAMAQLESERTLLESKTTLTAADMRRILLLLVRCMIGVGRLILRRL